MRFRAGGTGRRRSVRPSTPPPGTPRGPGAGPRCSVPGISGTHRANISVLQNIFHRSENGIISLIFIGQYQNLHSPLRAVSRLSQQFTQHTSVANATITGHCRLQIEYSPTPRFSSAVTLRDAPVLADKWPRIPPAAPESGTYFSYKVHYNLNGVEKPENTPSEAT